MSRPDGAAMSDRMVGVARTYGQEAAARAPERFDTGVGRNLYRFAVQNVVIEQRGRYGVRITVRGLRAELWAREIIAHIVALTMTGTELDYRMHDVDNCSTLVTW